MKIGFTKEQKQFIDPETKQPVDYFVRNIVIDGIPFPITKKEYALVFDMKFAEEIEDGTEYTIE